MDSIGDYKSDEEQDSDSERKPREPNLANSNSSHNSAGRSKKAMKDSHDKEKYSPERKRKESKPDSSNSERNNTTRSKNEKRDDRDRTRDDWDRPRKEWDRNRDERDRSYDKRHENRERDDRRRDRYQARHHRPRDYRGRSDRDRRHWRSRSSSRDRYGSASSPADKRDKDRKRYSSQTNSSQDKTTCSSSRNSSSHTQETTYNSQSKARDVDRLSENKDQFSSPAASKDTLYQSSATYAATATIDLEPQNKAPESSAALPSYYNPSVINPNKYAEQVQKRKLIWGNKKSDDTASKWGSAKFAQDTDGKVASKFMRLMGIKDKPKADAGENIATTTSNSSESIKKQEEMFSSMEQQYEVARQATHTMRGVGLGFGSQSRPF